MKAVITGASSFIGLQLAKRLSIEGWDTILVMRPGRVVNIPNNAELLQLSMEQYSMLGKLTNGCDCFIHFAWKGTRGSLRMNQEMQRENVYYSLQGIESMLNAGCGKVVLAGSQAEYGLQLEPTLEMAVCKPHTEYGKAKLALSRQVHELCIQKNVSHKLLRIFSVYGPGDHPDTMIMSILNQMLRNRPCKLTECTQMWDFLYVSDAVEAISRLCSLPCANGVYNIASSNIRPLKSYVEEMLQVTQSTSQLLFGALPYPETGKMSLWPDVSKLQQELEWAPKVTFATGIQTTVEWLKTNYRCHGNM